MTCIIDNCAKDATVKNRNAGQRLLCKNHAKLAQTYGLEPQDLQMLLAIGECMLCGSTDDLHIDHDHQKKRGDPGYVRGLLCFGCNASIGRLGDTAESLRRAVNYLEVNKLWFLW